MEEVALADGLDDERVLRGGRDSPGPRGSQQPELRLRSRIDDVRRDRSVLLAQPFGEAVQRVASRRSAGLHLSASSIDAAAASRVRSIASSSWASETNHASNCEGGG